MQPSTFRKMSIVHRAEYSNEMAMVDVGDSSLEADSQPKSVGLVICSTSSDEPSELL